MKKLFIINILLLISSFGFSQHQDSTATATITIEPPSDALWNEIFCYCVEYIDIRNTNKQDTGWKSVYVVPKMDKKGRYTKTSCVLTGLTAPTKHSIRYLVRVYAFYCWSGFYGYGTYGSEILFQTLQNGRNVFVEVSCGPLEHLKNGDAYNTSSHAKSKWEVTQKKYSNP